jgi:hypothetical protein
MLLEHTEEVMASSLALISGELAAVREAREEMDI